MAVGRQSTLQSIAWVRDQDRAKQLDLNPPYQRLSVWSAEFKQFLIDTILKNYAVPPIFVNVEVQDDGSSVHHVIDGKQRLSAILEFLTDQFKVSKKSYSPPQFAGKYFSELDLATQKAFYSYYLRFEFFTEATEEEVIEIFDRFNRNTMRLNAQELRHAKFGGEFISLMENMADGALWRDLGIFSKANIRRMTDVEFVSVIFLLTMHGIEEDEDLDYYYAEYDEEIPDKERHMDRYARIASMLTKLHETILETRLRNLADFYSLWSALIELEAEAKEIDYEQSAQHLKSFVSQVDEVPKLTEGEESEEHARLYPDAHKYSQAVRAGTTKKPNREIRRQLLKKCFVCA